MANKKSKSNPIRKEAKSYMDLFYMTPTTINAKDIARTLEANSPISVQLWEEMNIVELELPNQNAVDFELIEISFQNPSDAAFVKNRNINTIFAISMVTSDLDTVIPYFEQLVHKYSGFVCADSEDFTPVYAGSSKKA